jgi:DcrB
VHVSGVIQSCVALGISCLLVAGCGGDSPGAPAARSPTLVQGTGYAIALPDGWHDVTPSFSGAGDVDRVVGGAPADGFTPNVIVSRQRSGGASVSQLVLGPLAGARTLADDAGVGRVQSMRLDGRPARTFAYRLKHGQRPVRQRTVVVVDHGSAYVITFSALASGFAAEEAAFRAILLSWRWD